MARASAFIKPHQTWVSKRNPNDISGHLIIDHVVGDKVYFRRDDGVLRTISANAVGEYYMLRATPLLRDPERKIVWVNPRSARLKD